MSGFVEYADIPNDEWTLIGDNVSEITFQNAGQFGIYINFNSSNTAPSESTGLVYGPWEGEIKKACSTLTYKVSPDYVFARAISKTSTVIVETT